MNINQSLYKHCRFVLYYCIFFFLLHLLHAVTWMSKIMIQTHRNVIECMRDFSDSHSCILDGNNMKKETL